MAHDRFEFVDQASANTVADMATGCAALDHSYATWSSHHVEEMIARELNPPMVGSNTTTMR
jgi:hypothetical protein